MSYKVAVIGCSAGGRSAISYLAQNVELAQNSLIVRPHVFAKDVSNEFKKRYQTKELKISSPSLMISPATVYVISPFFDPQEQSAGDHISLQYEEKEGTTDMLMKGVAAKYESNGIGVVLSGSDKDGGPGVKAIKDKGGVVLVHYLPTPDDMIEAHRQSLRYSSEMPVAAIEALKPDTPNFQGSIDGLVEFLNTEFKS